MTRPGTTAELVRVDLAVMEAGALLPRHPAGREQVFVVVWSAGEEHTSWADTRMTVVIIQRRREDAHGLDRPRP